MPTFLSMRGTSSPSSSDDLARFLDDTRGTISRDLLRRGEAIMGAMMQVSERGGGKREGQEFWVDDIVARQCSKLCAEVRLRLNELKSIPKDRPQSPNRDSRDVRQEVEFLIRRE